jgi:hypothetical protein
MEIKWLLAQKSSTPDAIDNKPQGLTILVASGHIYMVTTKSIE